MRYQPLIFLLALCLSVQAQVTNLTIGQTVSIGQRLSNVIGSGGGGGGGGGGSLSPLYADFFTSFESALVTNNAVVTVDALNDSTSLQGSLTGNTVWTRNGGGVFADSWNKPQSLLGYPAFGVTLHSGSTTTAGTNCYGWDMGAAEEAGIRLPAGFSSTVTNMTVWWTANFSVALTNVNDNADDVCIIYDLYAGAWCVFQFDWDATDGASIKAHSVSNNITQFSPALSVNTNTPYLCAMNVDGTHGYLTLQIWDTNGTSLGTVSCGVEPVTAQHSDNGYYLVLIGQDDGNIQPGSWVYLDNVGVDWSHATWPLTP